jgi:hypothetical protein
VQQKGSLRKFVVELILGAHKFQFTDCAQSLLAVTFALNDHEA